MTPPAAARPRPLLSSGTVGRTVFDGRGNAAAQWVGADDAGATDLNPAGTGNGKGDISD